MPAIFMCSAANAGSGRHSTSFASESWEPEGLILLKARFDEWTGVFGAERLTGELLDRLTHHVHILEMNGDSYRLKQSKQRQRRM